MRVLVLLQFFFLLLLSYNYGLVLHTSFAIPQLLGLVLGLWSVWVMRKSKLSIMPSIAQGATLIDSGPYRFIRHPMYTALLLWAWPIGIENFSFTNLLICLGLTVALMIKLLYEERLWVAYIPQYQQYQLRSWRLLPFVW